MMFVKLNQNPFFIAEYVSTYEDSAVVNSPSAEIKTEI